MPPLFLLTLTAVGFALIFASAKLSRRSLLFGLLAYLVAVPMAASAGALETLINAATPSVMDLIGVALTFIIGLAATTARQRWGLEIEEKHRDALHWALYTASQLALERRLTGTAAIDLIKDYVQRSVPDAISYLKPAPQVLTDLAQAKLADAAREAATKIITR